jgi:nitrogen regulatory protein PII
MKRVKRMEIVVDTLAVPKVLGALEASGLSGWTVVRDVTGKGERGLRAGDELTGVAGNGYVLTACEPEELARVTEAIRPILRTFGGVCLVSDAEWLLH